MITGHEDMFAITVSRLEAMRPTLRVSFLILVQTHYRLKFVHFHSKLNKLTTTLQSLDTVRGHPRLRLTDGQPQVLEYRGSWQYPKIAMDIMPQT
jgi:hypothetical protein